MKIIRDSKEVFAAIEPLVQAGQFDSAKQQLEDIHIEYHDDAFVHLQVHRWLFRIARIQRQGGRMLGQIAPIIFAVPTSWVQRYMGLALPSRTKKNGC